MRLDILGLEGPHRYWLGINDRHSEGSFSYLDETAAVSINIMYWTLHEQ